jgi:hypothetical protein
LDRPAGGATVTSAERTLLALALILVDLVAFALPLTAFLAAYLILARPPWFRDWVARLYERSS